MTASYKQKYKAHSVQQQLKLLQGMGSLLSTAIYSKRTLFLLQSPCHAVFLYFPAFAGTSIVALLQSQGSIIVAFHETTT